MPLVCLLMFPLSGFVAAQAAPDEIDAFIKGFDSMSLNGTWPGVDLSEDAPIEKVVETFAKTQKKTADSGQYEGYRIVETKKIGQQSNSELSGYTVVLISSSRGSETILLMRNMGRGWSIRPYFITTVP